MSERLSAEQLAEIREIDANQPTWNGQLLAEAAIHRRALLRELDAVTRERDEAIERAERCEAYYNALTSLRERL